MKKLLVIVVIVLAAGSAVYLVLNKDNKATAPKDNAQSSNQTTATTFNIKKACDVLTLDDAKRVLGDKASGGQSPAGTPTESGDLVVSSCTYNIEGAALGENSVASLLVRAAKSNTGVTSNNDAFGSLKPADAQDVSGYGDKAFWNPQFGQLNILKNNNWYIISFGPLKITERNVEQTKKLADAIITKL